MQFTLTIILTSPAPEFGAALAERIKAAILAELDDAGKELAGPKRVANFGIAFGPAGSQKQWTNHTLGGPASLPPDSDRDFRDRPWNF